MAKFFFDTNVLVYAYDDRDAQKRDVARALLRDVAVDQNASISTQVIQEFSSVFLSKLGLPIRTLETVLDGVLEPLLAHAPDISFYKRAIILREKYHLAFYDSLIVQAAIDLDSVILYSEDLQDRQAFGSLVVHNPFH